MKNFNTYKKKEKFDYAQRNKPIQSMDFWSDYANQAINYIKETGYKNQNVDLKAPYIMFNWYL